MVRTLIKVAYCERLQLVGGSNPLAGTWKIQVSTSYRPKASGLLEPPKAPGYWSHPAPGIGADGKLIGQLSY
jgi:hypothetical protein